MSLYLDLISATVLKIRPCKGRQILCYIVAASISVRLRSPQIVSICYIVVLSQAMQRSLGPHPCTTSLVVTSSKMSRGPLASDKHSFVASTVIITLVRQKKPGLTANWMVRHKKARFDTKNAQVDTKMPSPACTS